MGYGWDEELDGEIVDDYEMDDPTRDYDKEVEIECRRTVHLRRERYEHNKEVEVGGDIHCANCGKAMVKNTYQTQFCSNKGKGNCKDIFWNSVSTKRRERSWTFKQ